MAKASQGIMKITTCPGTDPGRGKALGPRPTGYPKETACFRKCTDVIKRSRRD